MPCHGGCGVAETWWYWTYVVLVSIFFCFLFNMTNHRDQVQHQLQAKDTEPNMERGFRPGCQQCRAGSTNFKNLTKMWFNMIINVFCALPCKKRKFGWFFKIVCLKDNLRVDVWDFNDEESVNDKFGKINQVGRTLLPWWSFFKEFTSSTRSKMDEVWGSS